jgi:glutamate-ammonia-ligase adenylyltransferase
VAPARKNPTPFQLPTDWPAPHDPAAAARLNERFAELGPDEARIARQPAVAAMLAALGGNSPYLSDLAVREAPALLGIVSGGPDRTVADAFAALATIQPSSRRPVVTSGMRRAKRIVALATAIADIGGIWNLVKITGALTRLAETTLRLAVAHLLRTAHDRGELALPDPDEPAEGSGFVAIGMGKLGARELNYSSDIDLVLLYDPAAPIYTSRTAGEALGGFTSRLARDLVTLMEARDADGYVFRTDLRLRPDPAATPPAIALPAALIYYESLGQNWERAAMIKARPVAGDLKLGAGFLEAIRPFIWRKGLDFAALADIQAMKRRMDQHAETRQARSQLHSGNTGDPRLVDQGPVARIAGHNVKLGEGGIREIEFLAQTLQLVWGGRDPSLRVNTTLEALRLLVRAGHLGRRAATELARSYGYLRKVEHRLQMVADRQTHVLPDSAEGLQKFSRFMGYDDALDFAQELQFHLDQVGRRYAEVFGEVPGETIPGGEAWDFSGVDEVPPQTAASLTALGYTDIPAIVAAVRGWQSGRPRALRSDRARALIAQMLSPLLTALARQPQPDTAFSRFDILLFRLPAGVQLLSLFQRNPHLLERIAGILGAAPWLADHLASHPAALDGLLHPEDDPDPGRRLRSRLRDASTFEDIINITRRMVREEEFALAVGTMDGRLDADTGGAQRTALADAVLASMLEPVMTDFAARFGRVRGSGMAVVALGKTGSREMMAGSDLDLMLIYDHPEDAIESRGGPKSRTLPVSTWFVRAAHAYIAAVTAPGADGPLYAVDMRLRPSGNKGPVAVSLRSFQHYHANSAWTWERLALTRARVIAGPPALRARIEAAITEALTHAGTPDLIRTDTAAMRARLARDMPPIGPWDVKLRAGGQIEVEFIAQALQLVHMPEHPEVHSETTRIALRLLADAGMLSDAEATTLIRAGLIWRTVQGMLRILLGRGAHKDLSEATAAPLLSAVAEIGIQAVDSAELLLKLDDVAREVRAIFVQHVGAIG